MGQDRAGKAMCKLIKLGESLQRHTTNKHREKIREYVAGWGSALLDLCADWQKPEDFFLGFDQVVSELTRWKDEWEKTL